LCAQLLAPQAAQLLASLPQAAIASRPLPFAERLQHP